MSKIKYILIGVKNENHNFFKLCIFCSIMIFYFAPNDDAYKSKENTSVIAPTITIAKTSIAKTYINARTAERVSTTTVIKELTTVSTESPTTSREAATSEVVATTLKIVAATPKVVAAITAITKSCKNATKSPKNRTSRVTTKTPTIIAAKTSNFQTTSTHLKPLQQKQQQQPQLNKSNYYVLTSQCRIPYVDPFTPALLKIFKPRKPAKCSRDRAIITPIYNVSTRKYTLKIAKQNLKTKDANGTEEIVSCCYRTIVRSGSGAHADENYKLLPCTNFHQDFVVPTHIDAMIVDCKSSSKKLVQQDAFSFIQYKNLTTNTTRGNKSVARNTTLTLAKRKPSILFIGIDSLSRINFRRNMPQTFKYMKNNSNWIELEGYNKMGDNTYPNLMAIFTGYNNSFGFSKCKPKKIGGLELESCNMIWNTFKKNGYRTAFAEDTSSISTFNYLKRGFEKQPTDHYFRPMALAIEKVMHVEKMGDLEFCIGRKQYGEYIYDFGQQFANVYSEEPKFGFFWTNSFSHNYFDISSTMDNRMLEYLKAFGKDGILESSIVVLFSDHGFRWGSALKLPEGFLEERLPMFFISLPKWFRNEYPEYVEALKVNRHRLTSPYDIHMTLKHILELGSDSGEKFPASSGCKKCQSIFHIIPENRTCTDAGIIEQWCTCVPYQIVSNYNKAAIDVTKLVIKEMNKYLQMKNISSECSAFSLQAIQEVHLKMKHHDTATDLPTYRITYFTNPKGVKFQATAIYDPAKKTVKVNVEDISRLSRYENTSKCINDKQAKKYCICK